MTLALGPRLSPAKSLLLLWPTLWAAAELPGNVAGSVSVPTVEIAAGVRMPAMSIGTGGLEREAASQIASTWLSLGGRGLDCAWIYRNQDAVRKAIANSGVPRSELFITSKIPGCAGGAAFVENDLKELGVEYIDLMLIHFPRPSVEACLGTWKILEDYRARGLVKSIGVSNFQAQHLKPLLGSAKVVPAVNQIQHNILERDEETLSFCAANNITVEAYSPLGRSGRSGDIPGNKVIQAVAASHKVSPYQVALKWILQHGHTMTFQSSSAAHQASDADIFRFTLSRDEMAALDALGNTSVFADEHLGEVVVV